MGCPHSKEQNLAKLTQTKIVTVLTERAPSPQDAFQNSIKHLVEQNLYSDLTIICPDDRYPVHRAIVCPRSKWFTEKCKEVAYESAYIHPSIIYMDQPEDPYVIAAMLTYLYTLDYVDEGPQMSFGLPSDPNAKWLGDIGVEETMLPEYSEDDESPLIEWEELKSESEFNFAPDAELVVNTIDNNFEGAMDKDNEWESMSKSSTARKTPSPCHCSNTKRVSSSVSIDRDTGKPITPLALHVQMYTAGVRFGIPCLVSHALRKLENRICQNNFDDEELIEAASHAWRDLDEGQNINIEYNGSISIVRTSVLASMKARWQSVRVRDGFEELVLRRPGFGRDVLRIV